MTRAVAILILLLLPGACGPATPRPTSGPPAPEAPQREGQPSPVTITATRDFSVVASGDALAELSSDAASRAPLHYAAADEAKVSEAAVRGRLQELERWVKALQRAAKTRTPVQLARFHQQQGTLLGHALSGPSFARLRATPPALLLETLATLIRAVSPYRVARRSPVEEAFKGEKVIVHVEGKAAETELAPDRIKEMKEVTAELERLAAAAGEGKLPRELQRDLVQIASSGIEPTLSFDAARSRAARQQAVEAARKEKGRVHFSRGQVVLEKGEIFTRAHRQILATMHSRRCTPCAGGLARCGSGALRLLRAGSISYSTIVATRDFRVAVSGAGSGPARQVFVLDEKVGTTRAEKLQKLLDLSAPLEGKERWEKLRDGLERELGVEVILPLLQGLGGVAPEKLDAALLELYRRAQATPLVASKPLPRPGEPCVLRRLGGGKAAEETDEDCPVVPLARYRLLLPRMVESEPGLLTGLPAGARRASVELIQALLVANTRSSGQAEAKKTRTGERSFLEGGVVVPAQRPLTADDIKVLEEMVSLTCTRVVPGTEDR